MTDFDLVNPATAPQRRLEVPVVTRSKVLVWTLALVGGMSGCAVVCDCSGPTYTLLVHVSDAAGVPMSTFIGELEIGPSRLTVRCPGEGANPNIRCLTDGFAADLDYEPAEVTVRLQSPRATQAVLTPVFAQTAMSDGCCGDTEHSAEGMVTVP